MIMIMTVLALAVQFSAPARISTIDTGKLKGEPTELAWSPDGTQLFLQTSERDPTGMIKNPRLFLMAATDGKPQPVDAAPDWVTDYWTWKSNKYAPGSKTLGVEVKEDQRQAVPTASPMGGALAKGGTSGDPGGGGTSLEEASSHAAQMQKLHVFLLTLNGENVGEFVNQQFLPGYTFGWSPKSLAMLAYRNQSGKLGIMSVEGGKKQQIDSTKDVILPAWSTDGSKIAFLQRSGKTKFDLYVVTVTP
jgi:Tol biopolymer transport system component